MQENIKELKLTNFKIIKDLEDKWGKQYYIIKDENNIDDVYFCFEKVVKEGWNILCSNTQPNSILIEYTENEQNGRVYKRVTHIENADNDILI